MHFHLTLEVRGMDRVIGLLETILTLSLKQGARMTTALDTLTTEVGQATTVMQSAATLIAGLKSKLDDALAQLAAGDNGAALTALSAELDTSANALATAVATNTPAETPPQAGTGTGDAPTSTDASAAPSA